MPPRRPARPTPPDVDALRASLGQGKIVRVGIAPSDQFPDGVTGRVRRIGNPAVDGDEYLFVEVPVGGTKDVLPFAAKDLTNVPARKPVALVPTSVRTPHVQVPRALVSPPIPPRLVVAPPAHAATSIQVPSGQSATPSLPTTSFADPSGAPLQSVQPTGRAVPKNAPSGGRGKRAPVTITISTAGDDSAAWRIEARIGVKVAVRPMVIPPSRVWDIVQSLGEPKLTEVVQTLLDDHRRSTQARADALAAELSSLQAELSSFPS